MPDFYVYVHRRADTGAPFYVGKGHGDRARRHSSRNPHWRNVVARCGPPHIEFVAKSMDEELAFLVEQELIAILRRRGHPLVNMTDGGEGPTGLRRKPSPEEVARRAASNRGQMRTAEQRARIAAAKAGHGLGRKQDACLVERRIAPLRGRSRPDVALALAGLKRPPHVMEALRVANDARFANRRNRIIEDLRISGDKSAASIARRLGVDRNTVRRYRNAPRPEA